MTTRDDLDRVPPEFDRLMTAWFDAEARVHEPDDLLERTVSRTVRIRPRPAWLLPERWYPMELTMRRARVPRAASYLILVVVVALLAATAIAIIGSQRRVPAPFGPASNGVVVYTTSTADIATVDPSSGVVKTIIGGTEADRAPSFSRDGLRIAFVRKVSGGDAVFVADATGERQARLTPEAMAEVPGVNWSPDGTKLAFVSLDRIWIAKTDGSGASRLDLGDISAIVELAWRPPDGRELILAGVQDGKTRLFVVRLDGTGLERISPIDGNDLAFQWVTPSPDGSRVAFGMFPETQIHVATIDGKLDQIVAPSGGVRLNFPRWSPDGTKIAVMQVPDDDDTVQTTRIGVFPADDASPQISLTGPAFTGGVEFDWSPDGRSLLANQWDSDVTWLLDPTGGPATQNSWKASFPGGVPWQRRAP